MTPYTHGGDVLTAQTNLAPLDRLGETNSTSGSASQTPVGEVRQ